LFDSAHDVKKKLAGRKAIQDSSRTFVVTNPDSADRWGFASRSKKTRHQLATKASHSLLDLIYLAGFDKPDFGKSRR
jgi:hypothetical protein